MEFHSKPQRLNNHKESFAAENQKFSIRISNWFSPRADLLFVWWVVELMEARSETADGPKKKKMKAFSMHKILFAILKNRLK